MRSLFLLAAIVVFLSNPANATVISWTTEVVASSNVTNPGNVLGVPDNALGAWVAPSGTGTYGSFTGNTSYDSAALAALLGVSASTLAAADFVALEFNGSTGLGIEGSHWLFDDGSSTLSYTRIESTGPSGIAIGAGGVSNASYAAFFGLPSLGITGEWAFLLFDLAGLDVSAPGFTVNVRTGTGADGGTPDIDAMGVLQVPEPASALLLGLALSLLALSRRHS
jgi:hypothetical protein